MLDPISPDATSSEVLNAVLQLQQSFIRQDDLIDQLTTRVDALECENGALQQQVDALEGRYNVSVLPWWVNLFIMHLVFSLLAHHVLLGHPIPRQINKSPLSPWLYLHGYLFFAISATGSPGTPLLSTSSMESL